MRNNQPVTQNEYVLPDDEVIITHTDIASRITYANPAFVRSSEFSLEECMGQPQNIVRHPDMPAAAFADLWETIRSGKSWTGIVKNRRKSGGFYWVRANVTPMIDNGRIAGYMSVRVKAQPHEIRAAERLYAAMRTGQAGRFKIKEGRVMDTSLAGMLGRLARPTLKVGTLAVVGTMLALFASVAVSGALHSGWSFTTVAGALGTVIALCNILYIQSKVVQPLAQLARGATGMMGGDTRNSIKVGGDGCVAAVAETLEQVRIKLDGVLKDNVAAATHVRESVSDVVAANAAMSNRTNEHAASLEETAASLEQLTATVSRNTDNSSQAAKLAQDSSQATSRGREVVSEMFATMNAIAESSQRIGEIVGIIDGIAFQTNLLALNAAVEAARAGEQGRGFAVVAQEVGSLAKRSAASARQIKELIETSRDTVSRGSSLASQAEQSMEQVVQSVQRVTGVIAEIENASREQYAGIEQINKAVTQMDAITQEDAHMAQQLMTTAEGLQAQSRYMLTAISAFSMHLRADDSQTTRPRQQRTSSTKVRPRMAA